jgi:hypothetical protein
MGKKEGREDEPVEVAEMVGRVDGSEEGTVEPASTLRDQIRNAVGDILDILNYQYPLLSS